MPVVEYLSLPEYGTFYITYIHRPRRRGSRRRRDERAAERRKKRKKERKKNMYDIYPMVCHHSAARRVVPVPMRPTTDSRLNDD